MSCWKEVDSSLMMKYESYLKSTGICPNTTSYYMRNLRAIYNRAVEKGLTVQRSPFKYVYTGIDKTVKRAIPLEEIRRLKELDLTKSTFSSLCERYFHVFILYPWYVIH